jgi:tetratricopeptide (TPR) repeat protein
MRIIMIVIAVSLLMGPAWAGDSTRNQQARAASLADDGWRLIRIGDYARAADTFAEASALAPADASPLVGLGVSQHLLVRDDEAGASFQKALALDPAATQAHKFLGDIAEQRGETGTALRHYEIAARQDPNDAGIKGRLLAARRAAAAEAELDRLFSVHFVVKFHRSADRAAANAVADRLEAVHRTIGTQLSYFPASRVVVVLYPREQFQRATVSPEWARGLFDGRIHLAMEQQAGDRAAAEATLRHEYTHVVVHRLSGGQAPAWLSEGLALYMERGPDAAGLWERETRSIRAGERPPLAALHRSFLELAPDDASLAYAESYAATRALVARHGLAPVRRLLAVLSVVPDFAEAFETVFHERYSDFDAAWATTLSRNGR